MPLETISTLSGGNKDTQDRLLALWYFESHLKTVYQAYVDAVIAATFDTVSAHKTSALKVGSRATDYVDCFPESGFLSDKLCDKYNQQIYFWRQKLYGEI